MKKIKKKKLGLMILPEHLHKILSGKKTWELRSRNTNIRGKIYLMASGTGRISGYCELVDSIKVSKGKFYSNMSKHRARGYKSPLYAWVLKGAHRLKRPKPYKHPPGAIIWVRL
ncbi:MAG: ASCH domain-containing protein [bacterium]